jgi:flagellar biosynthesis protein FlhA
VKSTWQSLLSGSNELVLIGGTVGILVVLFAPIPSWALDFLLLVNFALALLVLLVTFYTEKPLEFSTFPSLLLMTTLLRLALNISSTRLILDDAFAGKVIDAIGTYVIGGNYVIGLVVFLILVVVQYVVVTNGAQRVAEVAARFTLDSLPGKQMSIDADLNMGIIDQDEAKRRRSKLEKESNFYGAMDGASKFVKGDAIAGIIIILINIIGGLSIGIVQLDMPWQEALHRYTLLTVGDGIVTQIPSLVIAVATGIIITRAATDARLGMEINKQFAAHPRALFLVAATLVGVGLLPGVPLLPVGVLVAVLVALGWLASRNSPKESAEDDAASESAATPATDAESLQQIAVSTPFTLHLGLDLHARFVNAATDFEQRAALIRKQVARELGFLPPVLTIKSDSRLAKDAYCVQVYGVDVGRADLEPDALLAISTSGERVALEGTETREPTYGLPARWIEPASAARARAAGCAVVEPDTVLLTHASELAWRHSPEFLTRAETERMLDRRRSEMGTLIDELIPGVLSYSDVQRVLQALLRERVAIGNLEAILEVLVDVGRQVKVVDELVEHVRRRLGGQICARLRDGKPELKVMTLAPELERNLLTLARQRDSALSLLAPADFEALVDRIGSESDRMLRNALPPVLLCAGALRRPLRNMLGRAVPHLHIVAIDEVAYHAHVLSAAVITIESRSVKEAA